MCFSEQSTVFTADADPADVQAAIDRGEMVVVLRGLTSIPPVPFARLTDADKDEIVDRVVERLRG